MGFHSGLLGFVILSARKSLYHKKSIDNNLFWIFLAESAQWPNRALSSEQFSRQAAVKPQLAHTVRASFFWPSLAIAASEALDPPTPPNHRF
jgi:hypothetical protein